MHVINESRRNNMVMMTKRHMKMLQRMLAMMKTESDYDSLDEIRIINDGGGTGQWIIAIKPYGKRIRAAAFAMRSIFAEPVRIQVSEYWDVSEDGKEFLS